MFFGGQMTHAHVRSTSAKVTHEIIYANTTPFAIRRLQAGSGQLGLLVQEQVLCGF